MPEASARLINAARAGDGRVIAVGTTAVRAVESATGSDGVVRAREGWTDLVVTPERGVRVVDGLLTGLHEPEASHLLMLEAVAGRAAIDRGYEEALRGRSDEITVRAPVDIANYLINAKRRNIGQIEHRNTVLVVVIGDPTLVSPNY